MNKIQISFVSGNNNFLPREEIQLLIAWELPELKEDKMEVQLFWYTNGCGIEDLEIIETKNIKITSVIGQKEILFNAPPYPYSFSGKHVSLIWAIEAVYDKAKISSMANFDITPFRKKIVL